MTRERHIVCEDLIAAYEHLVEAQDRYAAMQRLGVPSKQATAVIDALEEARYAVHHLKTDRES